MGFGKSVDIKKLPNKEDILSCVTDEEIFIHFLGGIPRKPICSPIRKDNIPSFSIFYSDNYEKLMFKDFATGERGDVFVFVMRLLGLTKITDAFCAIASELQLYQFQVDPVNSIVKRDYVSSKNSGKVRKERINIQVKIREWSALDKHFWKEKYGFNKRDLEFSGIFPISHYFMNEYCKKADELAYAFMELKDGIQTFKIYQPVSNDHKWINNNDYSTWELWGQLPAKGKNLIIASSRKDSMTCMFTVRNPNLLASAALQSENVNAKENVIDELKERFDNIYVWYDNDYTNPRNPGRTAGKKMCELYNFKQLEIPEEFGVKDPSDFREKYGHKKTLELIKKLLKDAKNN
tara:strand:- start:3403 stop:4449 length:1047 start_codon:yes stop_codon:yes gene_type:complete